MKITMSKEFAEKLEREKRQKQESLKELHLTHELIYKRGTFLRNIGKTFYFVNILKGYLEVLEDENIIVILEDRKRLKEFIDMFFELDGVQSLEPKFKKNISKIDFNNNSNKVFFKFRNDGKSLDETLKGTSVRKITPICDLDNLPSYFFTQLNEYSESALRNIPIKVGSGNNTFIFDVENSSTTVSNHKGGSSTNVTRQPAKYFTYTSDINFLNFVNPVQLDNNFL